MGMEAADPMSTPRARNASFNHARRVATPLAQRQKAPPSHVAVPLPIAALPLRPGVSRLDSLFETAL